EAVGRHVLLLGQRREGYDRRKYVEQEGGDNQLPVADLVADDASDNDAEAKPGEPRPGDGPQLEGREPEFSAPVGQDGAADGEPDPGGENGQDPRPQQALGVWRNGYVADFIVLHGGAADLFSSREAFETPIIRSFITARERGCQT